LVAGPLLLHCSSSNGPMGGVTESSHPGIATDVVRGPLLTGGPTSGCSCTGTSLSGPVMVACGQTTCGTDTNTYVCNAPGGDAWALQSNGCAPVAVVPAPDAGVNAGFCACTGTGINGPVTVTCGKTTCGTDSNTYVCNAPGGNDWALQSTGCAPGPQPPPAPPPLSSWKQISTSTWPVDANWVVMVDGTVLGLASGGGVYALAPGADGTFEASSWTTLASMHDSRLYYGTQVLPDGRVMVVGGEYGTGNGKGEVYDPVANNWGSQFTTPAADTETMLLPDGTVYIAWGSTVWNPSNNSVTAGASYPSGGYDEASFVLLPDGSELTVPDNTTTAYRSIPSTGKFVAAGTIPAGGLYDGKEEIGPGVLLPNGNVFWLGGNGNTALYTPPTNATDPGSWAAGPSIPGNMCADDAPAAVLRNGHVLFAADKCQNPGWSGPTQFFDYDPTTNLISSGSAAYSGPAWHSRMLVLPTGQVLFTTGGAGYLYTAPAATTTPPAIQGIVPVSADVYQLLGTNLYGMNQGAAYGDDAQMASNYPLVRFECGGKVTYARSTGWTPGVVGASTTVETTNFTVPSNVSGACNLVVVANGVPSAPQPVTVTNGTVSGSVCISTNNGPACTQQGAECGAVIDGCGRAITCTCTSSSAPYCYGGACYKCEARGCPSTEHWDPASCACVGCQCGTIDRGGHLICAVCKP
jgi:hypothetical protein